ncbi:3-oxoacyl-ACP reductase [Amycolatopsis granulosa]|uniref:3-oxoacyl-ACP reductase n=1 Tax=Amycolatopsis granulosa TaxID=185684 RepID=UPI00141F3928|nr:3-oxoacyl-[acyl-carrier protein] reductase [Amycolatopsis granulosa]
MEGAVEPRVAVVTGAGAGLGRAEALALARTGASVVVNDVSDTARGVVDEIESAGGKALLVTGDVGERATADALVEAAVEHFGGLHVVVNNAGVLRDRMIFSMSDEEWDTVIRVHLRGHFLLSRNATAYWRTWSKATGRPVPARLISTASEAFLVGSAGQPNYAAAKAGIVGLTVAIARGAARYGVRANAICPRARTAMTAEVFGDAPDQGVDPLSVEHVAPLVAYLAAERADRINGQVFVVHGGMVALLRPPAVERRFDTAGPLWTDKELDSTVGAYFDERDPEAMFAATEILELP